MTVDETLNLLISNVQQTITTNGNKEITGAVHRLTLINIIEGLRTILIEPEDYLLNQFPAYDPNTTYEGGQEYVVSHDGKLWAFVSENDEQGVAPGTTINIWYPISALSLAHRRNKDAYLDFGGENQVGAAEIRQHLDNPPNGGGSVVIQKEGMPKGNRSVLNFMAGNNIDLEITDNSAQERVDIKVNTLGYIPSEFRLLRRSPINTGAHQGVTTDGTHIFTTGGDTSNQLFKYDNNWNLVAQQNIEEYFNDYPEPHYGGITYKDGRIYATISNYPTTPRLGNILVFDADSLNFIAQWEESDVLPGHSAAISYGAGYFWEVFQSNPSVLRQLTLSGDANFTKIADFTLNPLPSGNYGYQGICWRGNLMFANHHLEGNYNIDIYEWDGSQFTSVTGIPRPTNLCTQDLDFMPDQETFIMCERNYQLYESGRIYDDRVVFAKTV